MFLVLLDKKEQADDRLNKFMRRFGSSINDSTMKKKIYSFYFLFKDINWFGNILI
jgi:hypothetical protein